MVTKVYLDWVVLLKGELLGTGRPNHGPQQLSPPPQYAGYFVVDQCYGSAGILISTVLRISNVPCNVNWQS
jgi:hypothetical protein